MTFHVSDPPHQKFLNRKIQKHETLRHQYRK